MEEEGAQKGNFPRTEVAFAATKPFQRAFPDEVDEQNKKFTAKSWERKFEKPSEGPGFAKIPHTSLLTDDQLVVGGMVLGFLIFLGGYASYRYFYNG